MAEDAVVKGVIEAVSEEKMGLKLQGREKWIDLTEKSLPYAVKAGKGAFVAVTIGRSGEGYLVRQEKGEQLPHSNGQIGAYIDKPKTEQKPRPQELPAEIAPKAALMEKCLADSLNIYRRLIGDSKTPGPMRPFVLVKNPEDGVTWEENKEKVFEQVVNTAISMFIDCGNENRTDKIGRQRRF